jgi:hypothetical protein
VIVATGSADVRDVLVPVYDALELDWDPATTGSVGDEVSATWEGVRDAVIGEFSERFELANGQLDDETITLAEKLASEHEVG